MKKIKILHVIKSLGRGGAEMLLPETLRLHNKEQFEFHCIYFLPWKDQMVTAIQEQNGVVQCLAVSNNIRLLLKTKELVAYIRKNEIDIIHAHLPWAGVVARLAGRVTKVPVLYTEHNKQERYHFATRFLNLVTMPWLTQVIAVSKDVEQSIRKHKPSLNIPIKTIPNGVNTERFTPDSVNADGIRSQFNIPNTAPVIGTVAVFRFQKRLDVWLEIAKQVLTRNRDAHFVVVGDGPLRKTIELKIKELGLFDNVHLAGLQTEVRPYFALFDIYMMCSIFEGLPIALLEAMAMECAIITTDAGGIKEVIRDNIDGLVCSVDKPFKLVDFADELLKDDNRRKVLSLQARKRVQDNFSLSTMVFHLEEVYRQEYGDKRSR